MIVRFRTLALWKLFLPLAVLTAISVAMNPDAWLTAPVWVYVVFAAVAVFLTAGPFLMRRYYYLEFARDALGIHTLGRTRFIPWQNIESAHVAIREVNDAGRAPVILLKLKDDSKLAKVKRGLIGGDVSIMAVYEKPPEKVAALIEQWRVSSPSRG